MTDEILPDGEDGGGTPASKPTTSRKTTRTRGSTAKPAGSGGGGSPSASSKTRAARPEAEPVDDDTDAPDSGTDTVATGRSPDDEGSPATSLGLEGRDEDDGDDELEAAAHGAPGRPRSWFTGLRRWVDSNRSTALMGAVAVVLAVALILTLLTLGNRNALDGARTSAIRSARTDAVALAGYDYRHLDRDFSAVLAVSTPSFRRKFSQASDALKTTLSRYHATAVAHVVSAGLVSASTSRAVVLVFLTQKVTNATQKNSTTDRSQVEITLVQAGGRWLIDQVNLL